MALFGYLITNVCQVSTFMTNSGCSEYETCNYFRFLLQGFLKKYCNNNNDCGQVMHSICSENNECVCIANYIALNETTCAPLLNELCSNNEVCATSNAVCIANKCQCKRNYLPQSDNYCIPGYYNYINEHIEKKAHHHLLTLFF